MLRSARIGYAAALLVAVAACGDAGPALDADVNGVWDTNMTISEIPGATISGPVSIQDPDRKDHQFSGSFTLTLAYPGVSPATVSGSLFNGSINERGVMSADLEDPAWHLSGAVDGRTMSGTWRLVGDSATYTGNFSAMRR